jgi:FSR family fosmidomycin resistance protein-like MFS transporter
MPATHLSQQQECAAQELLGAAAPDIPALRATKERHQDYSRVVLLSAGHFVNDLFGNTMVSLTPYLIVRGSISTGAAGFLLLIYLIGSSVLQPLFGLMSDRSGRRMFAVLGPLWVGAGASAFGWGGNTPVLFGLAAFGGIGTAAFHPQAASMVDALSPRRKGWSMSIFSMGGNIGFALGPAAAAVIATVGLHWSPLLLAPGLVMFALLARFAPDPPQGEATLSLAEVGDMFLRAGRSLAVLVSVIAIRSGAQFALILLLPLYYHLRGFPLQQGSLYAVVLSGSGALGGLFGGQLSDRFGRRTVTALSLALAAPLMALALFATGPIVWPLLALTGAAMLASNSVTVVQGQELLPRNTGIASGLTLGLGFGLSGVLNSAITGLAAHAGIITAIRLVPVLPLVAAGLALTLRTRPGRVPLGRATARPAGE